MTDTSALAAAEMDTAADVLDSAARAIDALRTALSGDQGATFVAVVDQLAHIGGRVILTGMGKSGYIARKIAATMASTGTLAVYVHPAEAAHGDLGMISKNDAVIAISNSGETTEMADIIDYVKRFQIPLIALTSQRDSTLGKRGDQVLVLPPHREACPMGLAPTTSTTATLALGDALAMALMVRKGFTKQDFGVFHPGGKLGRQLSRVNELMHPLSAVPTVTPEQSMADVILAIPSGRFGCCGVIGPDGALLGIITDGDLRRHMAPDLLGQAAQEVMTAGPKTIDADALAAEALGFMNRERITGIFVTEADRPVGFIHVHDLLQAGIM